MVEFIIGQAGSGKTSEIFKRIQASDDNQCIIVPDQFCHDFDKKLYTFLGAERFNKVYTLSFKGLARILFMKYGDPTRNGEFADDFAKMILIYQAVNNVQNQPGGIKYYRTQSNGFAEEVLDIISDMISSGISPEDLTEKSKLFDDRLMYKTSDIAAIYSEYQRLMNEYGFKDNLENTREAAKVANLNGFFKGRNVFIDEFDIFSADQMEMLKVIITTADNVSISLRTEDITGGDYTLFELVNKTYRRIERICRENNISSKIVECKKAYRFGDNKDLEYVSANIMRNRSTEQCKYSPDNIKIFESRDMYSETEYVCAEIKHLVLDGKNKYKDIAIISNDITKYYSVLKAAFERYDIPYFMSVEKTVTHTAIMAYFTSLIDLLCSKKLKSEIIFRMLKSEVTEITLSEISILENYCYKWGVEGDMWKEPFNAPDNSLERIEALRKRIIEPLIKLKKKLSKKTTAKDICESLYDYLINSKADYRVGIIMNELIKKNRDYEAAELKRLWGCLMDILDSVYDTLGEREISFSETARLIKSMIGKITYSVPPQTLDAVLAASARKAILDSPKIVFVMGANDGDFPNQVTTHGLLSESDRQKLGEYDLEISTPIEDMIASERLVVYKSLSSASEKLYISYPLSDMSGQAKYPAYCVDNIINMFGEYKVRYTEDDIPLYYYAATLHSAYYHYMQNRNLNNVSTETIKSVLMNDENYRNRLEYVISRSAHSQNYHLDTDIMEKLKSFEPLSLSPTSVESYNRCHFKYFCEHFMRLNNCEKIELDARVSGEITHQCYYGILSKRTKREFLTMTYDELKKEINDTADKYKKDKLAGDFGKDAKFELYFNKLTERLSEVFLHTQRSLMESDFIPHKFELNLREKSNVVLPFGDGKTLSFGGIVDRADICRIGDTDYVRIVDYKSSRKKITAETLGNGINMQMLLYLFAVTEQGGIYENYKPAGVLYSPTQVTEVKLESHRNEEKNDSAVNLSLKTSALVLSDREVLDAMEKEVGGKYIPVEFDKNGEITKKSECITSDGMEKLKKLSYRKLTEMADSLYSGDIDANPLMLDKMLPCTYCSFVNICDNSDCRRYRESEPEKIAEAQEILDMKTEKKEAEE